MTMFSTVSTMVQHNQLLQAGLVAAPASAVAYSLREMPRKFFRFIKKWISLDIRLNNDMSSYDEALRFITTEVICERFTRNYNYQTEDKWNWDDDAKEVTSRAMSIGYGSHIGFYDRHLVFIKRSIEEESKTEKFKEYTNVVIFARKKDVITKFKDSIAEFAGRINDGLEKVQLKVNSGDYWQKAGKLPLRKLDTVFSANRAAERLVEHIRTFDAKKEWNHNRGLPHHTGILLYGPPGTGKSSLIHAAASETKRIIHYLSLASLHNDKELTDLMAGNTDWSKILLVLEDFDAAGVDVEKVRVDPIDNGNSSGLLEGDSKGPRKTVTLSTILNVLDGLLSPDGMVIIATTNHPENIDAAVLRPGRFDLQMELGLLEADQFQKMARLFDLDPTTYTLPTFAPMTGAQMRSLLLEGGIPAVEAYQLGLAA